MTVATSCTWCGRAFTPRTTGGKLQTFCRTGCRRAFDTAGRKYVAEAIADGVLTPETLRNGTATTRALALEAVSPAPADPGRAPVARSLDDLSLALADLQNTRRFEFAALPAELIERLLAGW